MNTLSFLLCLFVAVEHFFIAYVELFASKTSLCSKIFKLKIQVLQDHTIHTLFKNLGIYNLCVAMGLSYGIFSQNTQIQILFLAFISIVGIYGSMTSSKSIFFKQALPAILALAFLSVV